jgi:hypothetical protein
MITLYPKDYSSRITTAQTLSGYISDIDNVDFHRMIDNSVEGAEDFADEADKAVKTNSSKASQEIDGLFQEIENDVYAEFTEKFFNYIYLVENKVEDADDFPFREWQDTFRSLKGKPSMDYEEVLNNIDRIAETNKDVAKYNIASFLNIIQFEDIQISGLFPHLNTLVNKHFPDAKFIDLLSATNYSKFIDALNGNEVPVNENSHLFFEYAAYLPIENFAIKQRISSHLNRRYKVDSDFKSKPQNYPNSLGLGVSIDIKDMSEIYSAFENNEVWQKIQNSEKFKNIFIKNSIKFNQGSINKYYIDNADYFVLNLSKDDVLFAETFFTSLEKYTHGKEKEESKLNISNALKFSLKFILDKEIPETETKVKKPKL